MKKGLSVILGAMVFIFGGASASSASDFSDVPESDRFAQHIDYLYEEGIIQGFGNHKFGPEQPVTRAAAAIMLAKSLELDTSNPNAPFKDVGKSSKAAGAIQVMASKGIISGASDGKFYPDREVTRAEMAILLAKAFELKETNYYAFTDVSNSMKSYESIRKVVASGIATGYSESQYKPSQSLTRAQFSAFLARAMSDEFRLTPKKPGQGKVTTTEAYAISSQLVAELRKNIRELGEANNWGSKNKGVPEIAEPVLKEFFTNEFIQKDFKVFMEAYYCDCDLDIAPRLDNRMIRFTPSHVTNDSFTVTGLYLSNYIDTEPHYESIMIEEEDGKWKIDTWKGKNVTTENLNLTKKEVEKAIPDVNIVDEYYHEKIGSIVYEIEKEPFHEVSVISKKDGRFYPKGK